MAPQGAMQSCPNPDATTRLCCFHLMPVSDTHALSVQANGSASVIDLAESDSTAAGAAAPARGAATQDTAGSPPAAAPEAAAERADGGGSGGSGGDTSAVDARPSCYSQPGPGGASHAGHPWGPICMSLNLHMLSAGLRLVGLSTGEHT